MSHLKLHFTLHTWQSSHSTLHTSHCTLRTPHFTLHTAHFTVHTSHCTLRTPNVTLHSPHFTLHTPHFTLHSSCPTLHTAPFISSELFSPYPSSALLISSLLICHLSFHESLPTTTTKELACAVRQPGLCVRALCEAVAMSLSKNMTCVVVGKLLAPKLRKSADKSLWQPGCSHSNTNYAVQLQKTIVLRQPRHRATLTSAETELQNTIELRATASEIAASKPDLDAKSRKKTILKHFLKWFLERKLLAPKLRKSAAKSLSQPGCSHSNTIYAVQLQKTIVLRMQPRHQATLTQPLQCDLQRLSCKTQ